MATITRHPRYHPEDEELDHKLHWSSKIWVSNLFRAWEWLVGRRYGIRPEMTTSVSYDKEGNQVITYSVYTFEALCSFVEWRIREFFKQEFLPFRLVLFQPAQLYKPFEERQPWITFAIAFDNSANGTANSTSLTYSHTCTGSNLYLVVGSSPVVSGGENTNSITYNSVSMTQAVPQGDSSNLVNSLWGLINPSTGVNNVVISVTSTANIYSVSASYSGAKQSGQPDATGSANPGAGSPVSTITVGVTPVATNCWAVSYIGNEGGNALTASTNVNSVRGSNSNHASLGDSNGVVTAGVAYNMTWTCTSQFLSGVALSIAPAPSTNSGFLAFL